MPREETTVLYLRVPVSAKNKIKELGDENNFSITVAASLVIQLGLAHVDAIGGLLPAIRRTAKDLRTGTLQ